MNFMDLWRKAEVDTVQRVFTPDWLQTAGIDNGKERSSTLAGGG